MKDSRIFALICVLLGGMGQGIVAPKLPAILQKAEALALFSGISAALMYLGIFISTYRFGRWSDDGKCGSLLASGLALYSSTLIALSFFVSPGAIFAIRFVEGLSLSAIFVASDFILGRQSSPNERGRWLSYYGVALSAGLLMGPIVSLGTEKLALGLQISEATAHSPALPLLLVSGIAGILSLLSIKVQVPKLEVEKNIASPPPIAPLLSGALYGYMEAGLVAVFPVIAVTEFHVVPEYCLFAVILSAALCSIPWGMLSDRIGPRKIVFFLLCALAIGPVAILSFRSFFQPISIAFLSSIFFGTLAGGIYPLGFAWLLETLPESQYGYAAGSFARAYGAGSLLGPLACGIATQIWGSKGLFTAMAVAGIFGVTAVFFTSNSIWRRE